jgi:manganese transport protein
MAEQIRQAPRGLAMLALVGPSLIWCAEYIGSGEVVLSTRTGALFGTAALWAVVVAVVLKCSIGMMGARWTAVTGEGMIDLFSRIPGPRHWLVWVTLLLQLPAAVVSIGALARVAGVFLNSLIPLPGGLLIWSLAASLFAVGVAWTGRFDLLKGVMSFLVMIIVVGALYVALRAIPPLADVAEGMVGMIPLEIPKWVPAASKVTSPWHEVLPLMGWAAGGFASQVWYTYWCLGAGYGLAAEGGWGKPADTKRLAAVGPDEARRIRGWCRVVHMDATFAACIGVVVTMGFMLAGAGVLRPRHLLPAGNEVALTLSRIFSENWGQVGAVLFLVAGAAAMVSTLIGQLAGWPRLLADCARIVCPPFARLPWKSQFRGFLVFFVVTNAAALFVFDPVRLVQLGGQLDGILLTPVQALAILAAFTFVLPRLVPRESWRVLRLGPVAMILLATAAVVFGILCVVILPESLRNLLAS